MPDHAGYKTPSGKETLPNVDRIDPESIYLSIYLSMYLATCVSICLSSGNDLDHQLDIDDLSEVCTPVSTYLHES